MSEWRPPPAVAQDYPKSRVEPDGLRRLIDMVVGLKQELRELRSNLLGPAGLSVYPDGLTTDGDFNVNGSALVAGDLSSAEFTTGTGWSLAGTGDAIFTGDVAIAGTLSLPAGIIDNDALAAPVGADQASAAQTGFATATTDQALASAYITVPAGYTRALVMVVVTAGAQNTTGAPDYLYLSAGIGTNSSREVFAAAAAGASTSTSTARSRLLTDLTGGDTIHCHALVHTQVSPWSASAASRAYTEAIAVFLR